MSTNVDTIAAIRSLEPIDRLPAESQVAIAKASTLLPAYIGHIIFSQGHEDGYVHYLIDGAVELLMNGEVTKEVVAGTDAARCALDQPGSKHHTVRAKTHCMVIRIPRAVLDTQVLEQTHLRDTSEGLEVSDIAVQESSNWMIRLLQITLFARLPADNMQRIFGRMEEMLVTANEQIVEQGEEGKYYYIVDQGYCEVSRRIGGGRQTIHLADLGPGDAFGESALISDLPRNASIRMLSDGRLMRLRKSDFNELIRQSLLGAVNFDEAVEQVSRGTVWIDVRYPEEHRQWSPPGALNIPLNVLRIQASKLSRDVDYFVFGEEPHDSEVAAFLLIERGFNALFSARSAAEMMAGEVSSGESKVIRDKVQGKIVAFAGANSETGDQVSGSISEDTPVDSYINTKNQLTRSKQQLEDTIDKIGNLYSEQEMGSASNAPVPVEEYAETATGQSLADLINEMGEDEQSLPLFSDDLPTSNVDSRASRSAGLVNMDPLEIGPSPPAYDLENYETNTSTSSAESTMSAIQAIDDLENLSGATIEDNISSLISDFEIRLRDHVDVAAHRRAVEIEQHYKDELKRLRDSVSQTMEKQEAQLREQFEVQYKAKENLLRKHYKKVMTLANKVSRQKAQLNKARKHFEEKLKAANELYKQVEDMRCMLRDNLDYFDEEGEAISQEASKEPSTKDSPRPRPRMSAF